MGRVNFHKCDANVNHISFFKYFVVALNYKTFKLFICNAKNRIILKTVRLNEI